MRFWQATGRASAARLFVVLVACLAGISPSPGVASEPQIAVFNFELLDTSLEGQMLGENDAELERLRTISEELRGLLRDSNRYQVVDPSPAHDEIEAAGYLRSCNGCDAPIALGLGADLSLTGVVQKVSNLILNINLYLRDARSGKLLRAMSADIRGNTDESWSRGVAWLVRNRLLKE